MTDFEKENMDTLNGLSLEEDKVKPASSQKRTTSKWLSLVLGATTIAFVSFMLAIFAPTVMNVFAQTTKTPVEYYQSVEKSNLDKQIDELSKYYGNYLEYYKKATKEGNGSEVTLNATLDSSIVTPMGFEGLKSIKATILSMQNANKSKSTISLYANNKKFTSLNVFGDINKEMAYILIPGLSKAYLSTSLNPNYGELTGTKAPITTKEITALLNNNPLSKELLNKLLKQYSYIMVEEIKQVTITKGVSVTANSIINDTTKITATLDEKTLLTIAEKVLTTAKNDKDLLNLYVKSKLGTKAEYNTAIQKAIADIVKEKSALTTNDINKDIIMNVYVDGAGKITGRDFSNKSDAISFGYKTATKDSNVGFEVWSTQDSKEEFNIIGKATVNTKGVTGDAKITFYDSISKTSESYNIKFEDFKFTLENNGGFMNGKVTVTGGDLTVVSVVMNFNGNGKKQDMQVEIIQGGKELATINMKTKIVAYKDFKLPSKSAKIYDAEKQINEYMATADLKKYLEGVNKKIDVKGVNTLLDQMINAYSTK